MKNFFKKFGIVLAGLVSTVPVSYAALPSSATQAFTDLQTDALSLIDLAWGVASVVVVGFILLRMFKRGANAAT
jgi:hypothetical protein